MVSDTDFPVYYPENGPGDFYDENGVDLTQIRAFLAKTPEQRLRVAEGFAEDTLRIWAQNGIRPQVRVLELATLIEIKRRAGRPKDIAVMPVLEATLRESRRLGLK